ncbi:MAG: hypothetical protein IJV18_02325 [Acidaminococcaceae bacterium]|nr:hypothetical protein [Acidaminococcaceae bacterium]MBQ8490905.1 hypothetical protein [Acidaminococcaceae bacterium]MBQ9257853.1 hypothetical protein [Acidaminococcaceae bacterium]
MVTEKAVLGRNNKKSQTGKDSSGFIVITIIPVFLIMLSMITATMGCLSYVTQVMNLRNRLLICDWLLEDENGSMFQEALSNLYEQYKEEILENNISRRNYGPYILITKELRNKNTGKVIMNRFEFKPEEKTYVRKS